MTDEEKRHCPGAEAVERSGSGSLENAPWAFFLQAVLTQLPCKDTRARPKGRDDAGVGPAGVEPATLRLKGACSAIELRTHRPGAGGAPRRSRPQRYIISRPEYYVKFGEGRAVPSVPRRLPRKAAHYASCTNASIQPVEHPPRPRIARRDLSGAHGRTFPPRS